MKKLTESDIEKMLDMEFVPDTNATRRDVRTQLHLGMRNYDDRAPTPRHATLDLHNHTVEQSWAAIMVLAQSGVRDAIIITGASGILRQLFPQWVAESVLTPYIVSATPVNNGSFSVKFHTKERNK